MSPSPQPSPLIRTDSKNHIALGEREKSSESTTLKMPIHSLVTAPHSGECSYEELNDHT